MKLFKTLLKRFAQLLAALAGLVVLLYLVAVVINWNDAPPSELALQFEASLENRPVVADEDNAYIALRDLADSADEDFPRDPTESEYAVALAEDCRHSDGYCLDKVVEQQYGAKNWLEEHQWVLDRYIRMLSFTKFKEPIPENPMAIIDYSDAGYGQRLLMMSAMLSAIDGDQPHVVALLEADLKYWRMVLRNSDLVITKLIAAAYVRNHFLQGNKILRVLHETHRRHTLPIGWFDEITNEEHSFQRVLIGEWKFVINNVSWSYSSPDEIPRAIPGLKNKILAIGSGYILPPLFQIQDSRNRLAAHIQEMIRQQDVSLHKTPEIFEVPLGPVADDSRWFRSIYNYAGTTIAANFILDGSYVARTADLEGVRRAAIVTTLMREQQVASEDVPAFLAESEYRNPYTDEPFDWDSESQEVRFDGLRDDHYDVYKLQY